MGRAGARLAIAAAVAVACVTDAAPGRSVEAQKRQQLRVVGGVGYRQFMRINVWLADNLAARPDAPQIWFHHHLTGRGFRDSVLMLASGEAELALVNARAVAAMAVRGRGMFDRPITNLRAIAALPHRDWTLFAVDATLGVRSFAHIAARRVPLKLTTGFLDGDSAVGFIARELFRRHGVPFERLEEWGGRVIPAGNSETREAMVTGRADAVLQEGARGEEWEEMARKRPVVFLSMDRKVADAIEQELGFGSIEVPAGYYPGQTEPFLAPDFSDWLICVRDDLPEPLAYWLAQVAVEERQKLDREYSTESPRYTSINYPLDPRKLADTAPVPLHPGAARYYREHQITPESR